MDEYLFLTMAKLKADRKKLEQEQRELSAGQESAGQGARVQRAQDGRAAKAERDRPNLPKFVPFLSWR